MKIKAKKSLGQNFLIDKNILKKIVDVENIINTSSILEVGAGTGNLTELTDSDSAGVNRYNQQRCFRCF